MKKILLIILLIQSAFSTYANHILGADISYQNTGNNIYKFTLNIYRDCKSELLPFSYTINYKSNNCKINNSSIVNLVSSQNDVGPSCATQASTCNGGTNWGVQKWVYEGNISFPQLCTDWIITWNPTGTFRDSSITNMEHPEVSGFYLEAKLNNLLGTNNSTPRFTQNSFAYLPKNQSSVINLGVNPIDNDFLAYKLVKPRTNETTTITYLSKYNELNPISTSQNLTLNQSNGEISLLPTNEEISATALVVEEYRNGILVGSSMSDFTIIVKNNPNHTPQISGVSDSMSICLNQILELNFQGSDADTNQKITFSWNEELPNSTNSFTQSTISNQTKAQLIWNASKIGTYTYKITLNDNNCPLLGSISKTYKITVNDIPKFNLPNDTLISCSYKKSVKVTDLNSKLPVTYLWNNENKTDNIIVGPGKYWVKVTDPNLCYKEDTINIKSGVIANFIVDSKCIGTATNFNGKDYSFSQSGNDITKYIWNFGESKSATNFSNLSQPSHSYSLPGLYYVNLKVEDSDGCVGDTTFPIKICMPPVPDFEILDSCKRKSTGIPIKDLTTITICGISKYVYYFKSMNSGLIEDSLVRTFSTEYIPQLDKKKLPVNTWRPKSEGLYQINFVATNVNGCKNSITKTANMRAQPKMQLAQSNFITRCDISTDTTLLLIDTATTKKNLPNGVNGWKPLNIIWSGINLQNNLNLLYYKVPTNIPGYYTVKIEDQFGCDSVISLTVTKSIKPSLKIENLYCKKGDLIYFKDLSTSVWGIKKVKWDFGDGSSNLITNTSNPFDTLKHNYTYDGLFNLKGTFLDNTNCIETTSTLIKISSLSNYFSANPNPICVGSPIKISSRRSLFIDSISWKMGDGTTFPISGKLLPKDNSGNRYLDSNYIYKSFGAGTTKMIIDYTYNYTYPFGNCKLSDSIEIKLFPELKISVSEPSSQCADDPTTLTAIRTNGNSVTKWFWKFAYQELTPPFKKFNIDSTTEIVTDIIGENINIQNKVFTQNANYLATLKAQNLDGCTFELKEKAFNIIKMPVPYFCKDDSCATNAIQFGLFCFKALNVDITDYKWNFGDGQISTLPNPIHTFSKAGNYNINVELANKRYQCYRDTTIGITIKNVAHPQFTVDTVCLGINSQFLDKSTAENGDSIIYRKWYFGDGDSSEVLNPNHLYSKWGNHKVRMYVVNQVSKCRKEISDTAFVKPVPIAGFSADYKNIVAQKAIQFTDSSFAEKGDSIVSWFYDFGDKTSIKAENSKKSPIHTFENSKFYNVSQIVTNQFGCHDTLTKPIDLNVYLVLPSAFSPNNDGLNDFLIAHTRGIESINELKIFNRWGQKLFEYNNEGDLKWDGTYDGLELPNGVYVYYIKATSKTGEEIIKEGNITIVR